MIRNLSVSLCAAALCCAAAGAQTVSWNDAVAQKAAAPAAHRTPILKSKGASALRLRPAPVSTAPFAVVKSSNKKLSAPNRAVTAADIPGDAMQLTYGNPEFQSANPATITIEGDSICIADFFGLGTVKGLLDKETGTFTLDQQKLFIHDTYGEVDLMSCNIAANTISPGTKIPGRVADGRVEVGEWIAIIIDGEKKNYSIGGIHGRSLFVAPNAQMTSKVRKLAPDSTWTSTDVTDKLYVEQPAGNVVAIYNLAGSGGMAQAYFTSGGKFRISPTQLINNNYGAFFCYPADWSKGETYVRDLTGTVSDKELTLGNWTVATNTGQYYFRRMDSSVITLAAAPTLPTVSESWNGTGTADDPYQIASTADLLLLSESVNSAEIPAGQRKVVVHKGAHFKQTKAIDLKGLLFPPIGGNDEMYSFGGTYDGGNLTISNLTVNTGTKGYAALFGAVDTVAVIKNVSLSNPVVSSENYYYTGAVAAYCMGQLENCKVTNGNITGTLVVGGVSATSGPAKNLSFTGSVTGATNTGGVIGNLRFPASGLSATNATVTGLGGGATYSVGGVVGYLTNRDLNGLTGGTLTDSYFSGTVHMKGGKMFGGTVVGCSVEAPIARCFSIGNLYTSATVSEAGAGGIVGGVQVAEVSDCAFTGTLQFPGSWCGSIIGYAVNVQLQGHPEKSVIRNCYTACYTRSTSNYPYTPWLGWLDTRTGGKNPDIISCHFDAAVHPRLPEAPGLTPQAEMTSATPWEDFDTEVWKFEAGFYPTLKTIPANSAMNVAKAPVLFEGNDNVENASRNFKLPTANAVTWKVLRNGVAGTEGHGIIIVSGVAQLNGSVANDTVVASNGNLQRWLVVKTAPASMFSGAGTAEDPYRIATKEDLIKLSEATTTQQLTFDGSHFLITADIDVEKDPAFKGICNCASATYKFGGVLDGGNHTLHGIRLVYPVIGEDGKISGGKDTYRGFIGRLKSGAAVKNLRMAPDCEFEFYSTSGTFVGDNVGGDVINCRNFATVKAHAGTSGAIVGYNREGGNVIDCYNGGAMIGDYHYVGGIAAYNYGLIESCQNNGPVYLEFLSKQYLTSARSGTGGVVMANFGVIRDCLNTGSVSAPKQAGGIIGWYNTTPKGEPSMAGCLNLGTVVSDEAASGGEICGHQYKVPVIANNYWDAQTGLNGAADNAPLAGATGVSTAELTAGTPLEGMNAELWLCNKGDYPMLRAFADIPEAVAAAKAVVDFGVSANRHSVRRDALLNTADGLVWKLKSSSEGIPFAVNGATLELTAGTQRTDTLVASMGAFTRELPLIATPDSLDTPTLDVREVTGGYELQFSSLVEGVRYLFTLDGSAPAIGNTNVDVTDGVVTIKVANDCTLRAVAYHRSYFPSAEISKELKKRTSGIEDIDLIGAERTYINAAGESSLTPWQGVNIVVTRTASGVSIEKRIFNR